MALSVPVIARDITKICFVFLWSRRASASATSLLMATGRPNWVRVTARKSRGRHHVKPDAFTTDEPCDDNPVDKAEHSRNQTRRY